MDPNDDTQKIAGLEENVKNEMGPEGMGQPILESLTPTAIVEKPSPATSLGQSDEGQKQKSEPSSISRLSSIRSELKSFFSRKKTSESTDHNSEGIPILSEDLKNPDVSKSQNLIIKVDQPKEVKALKEGADVEFSWDAEPKEFGGFDQDSLSQLVEQAEDFFNVPKDLQNKIHLYFGDSISIESDNQVTTLDGIAYPVLENDDAQTIKEVNIVINRSKELKRFVDDSAGVSNIDFSKGDVRMSPDKDTIAVLARQPWEVVASLVAEEVNHAAVALKLGSMKKIDQASSKYADYIKGFHKDGVRRYGSIDLMETTAARQVLRFLKTVAEERDPLRIPIYEEAFQRSLNERVAAGISPQLVFDSTFIRTGYNPTPSK